MLQVQVCSASTGFNECQLYSHSCEMLFIPASLVGSEQHRTGARGEARASPCCKWRQDCLQHQASLQQQNFTSMNRVSSGWKLKLVVFC